MMMKLGSKLPFHSVIDLFFPPIQPAYDIILNIKPIDKQYLQINVVKYLKEYMYVLKDTNLFLM
jgi:hypothetical protein